MRSEKERAKSKINPQRGLGASKNIALKGRCLNEF